MYTFSKQLWGLHSPSTCLVQNFQILTGDNFFHTYNLHTCFRVHSPYSCLVYTLQAHVRFKIYKFSREFIFFILTLSTHVSGFTLHTVTLQAHVVYTFSNQLWGLHSPSTCLVQNLQIFTGVHFFFHTYTLHTYFTVHSPYSYLVYTLQAHVRFKTLEYSREIIFFMLTLSTHVSGFTLHTVIWFTLSKHMLGLKLSNFHSSSFFSYLHSPHMFQDSLSIQLFGLHSPSTC